MKPIQRDPSAARGAVSLLAVTFVIVCGLVACSTIVLTSSDQVLVPLGLCLLVFACIGWICYRLVIAPDRPLSDRAWSSLWIYQIEKPKVTYELRKVKRITPESTGPRQPPTAEALREAKETFARWVPASHGRSAQSATQPETHPNQIRRKQGHGRIES